MFLTFYNKTFKESLTSIWMKTQKISLSGCARGGS